jgi:kynureninase
MLPGPPETVEFGGVAFVFIAHRRTHRLPCFNSISVIMRLTAPTRAAPVTRWLGHDSPLPVSAAYAKGSSLDRTVGRNSATVG